MPHFRDQHPVRRDVVVTGIGMMTPLAPSREASWQRLLSGDAAGRKLAADEVDFHSELTDLLGRSPGGAPVDHAAVFELISNADSDFLNRQAIGRFTHDVVNNLMIASVKEALEHARLPLRQLVPERTGCVIGSSKPSLRAIDAWLGASVESDTGSESLFRNACLSDAPLRSILAMTGASGPTDCPVAACATGLVSVIEAAEHVRSGNCDVCIAGSADASLCAAVLASFHRLGVLSGEENPESACRPFDADRDGFIIGEGAAAIIVESEEHAAARNATSLGRLDGTGWLTDCTGITQIDSTGAVVHEVLKQLKQNLSATDNGDDWLPGFCCLHGTATRTNDLAEAHGLQRMIPDAVPGYGIKGATGHLLGAAGIVELATTILALRDGLLPPTANFTRPDPECRINISQTARRLDAYSGLKLSLGFGGHVVACCVQK